MRVTVSDVLDLPEVACGLPKVRAGSDALDAEVRWVHVSELANVAGTLSGGELVLSMGVVLAEPDTDVHGYLDSLCESGAAALLVELGRHVAALPDELVQAARARRFPLVELRAPVRFVEITGIVHARVVNARYERLNVAHRAHEALGPLGIEGASVEEILGRCADLIGRPVVLEDLAHRVVAFAGGGTAEEVLRDWAARSRQVPGGSDTTHGGPEKWISTPVGPRRRRSGRLVVPTRIDGDAVDEVRLVLERTAETVTISHLVTGAGAGLGSASAAALLRDVLDGRATDDAVLRARALALGFPAAGPIAVLIARGTGRGADADLLDVVTRAATRVRRPMLVGRVRPRLVAVLFDCPSPDDGPRLAERLAEHLDGDRVDVLAAGRTASGWRDLMSSLTEADHVAGVAPPGSSGARPGVVHGRDLGVRGLLWEIRDDSRLHAFIESRLGPILALPERRRESALDALDAFLTSNGVMADFARAIPLSRAAAYGRLRALEQLLCLDLSDAEQRTGVHLALLAHRQGRRHAGG